MVGPVGRARIHSFLLVGLVATAASVSGASHAAGAFDLEISGPGIPQPVTITWKQMSAAVVQEAIEKGRDPNGFNPFFHEVERPQGDLGRGYQLKVTNFIPTEPPIPGDTEFWTYYPTKVVIKFGAARGTMWQKPVPALRSLLNDAIPGQEPIPEERNVGMLLAVPAAATVIGLFAFIVRALRIRRTYGFGPSN